METDSRWNILDVVEGYLLSNIVWCFWTEELWQHLSAQQGAADWARARGYDIEAVMLLLEYVHLRTDLVERDADGYRIASTYVKSQLLGHMLEKYIGAFGPCARDLSAVLSDVSSAGRLVNRARHAAAFMLVEQPSFPALPHIVEELGVARLVDLGCGTGTLLCDLGLRMPEFRGVGVDANPHMLAKARERASSASLDDRIQFVQAEATDLPLDFAARLPFDVDTICAGSLLNELIAPLAERAIAFLRALGAIFPGKLLLVADYYGRLGSEVLYPNRVRPTLVHDVMQVISGQGVPPSDMSGWQGVYSSADCELLHAFDGEGSGGIHWFIHLVRLEPFADPMCVARLPTRASAGDQGKAVRGDPAPCRA